MALAGQLFTPIPLPLQLVKMRLSVPCRAETCAHLQCFDAVFYLQMNEKKPTWMCPVCDKPALMTSSSSTGESQGRGDPLPPWAVGKRSGAL